MNEIPLSPIRQVEGGNSSIKSGDAVLVAPPRERSAFLDFTKGILIFLVTLGHSIQYLVHHGVGFWDDPLFKGIYMFHMPLFMAIAGYLSHRSISQTPTVSLIRARFSSYLVPVFTWAVLYQLVLAVLTRPPAAAAVPFILLRDFITGFWFLWALFASIAITAFAKNSGRLFPGAYLLCTAVVLLLPDRPLFYLFQSTFPFFQAGYCVAHYRRYAPNVDRRVATVGLGVLSLVCYSLWNERTYIYTAALTHGTLSIWYAALRYLSGAAVGGAFLYFLSAIYPRTWPKLARWFCLIGRDSLYIYIIQSYFFQFWIELFVRSSRISSLEFGWGSAALVGLFVCFCSQHIGAFICRSSLAAALLFGKGQVTVRTPASYFQPCPMD